MALDGLYQRSKATASNIANVATSGYQRQEVVFEDQLQKIRQNYDLKEEIKLQNSQLWKNPQEALKYQDPAQIAFLQSNLGEDYAPQLAIDSDASASLDGNSVVLEEEMMNVAKTGTQYTTLSTLLGRSYKGLESVIKGS